MSRVLPGVAGAGLTTMVLPAAMAGPIFHNAMIIGKFHGAIPTTGPTGLRTTIEV